MKNEPKEIALEWYVKIAYKTYWGEWSKRELLELCRKELCRKEYSENIEEVQEKIEELVKEIILIGTKRFKKKYKHFYLAQVYETV